jgi:hypothetical protein
MPALKKVVHTALMVGRPLELSIMQQQPSRLKRQLERPIHALLWHICIE